MINNNLISDETNLSDPISKINETKEVLIFHQLHSAQQEINNLRLLNVCLQSTLLRVQSQLIDYLPVNIPDEIKRNETKQKLALLRPTDDHTRRIIQPQQISFIENLKNLFDKKQEVPIKSIPLSKNEKQIDILFEMFHELNTIIHTEHHDRICQLYVTLAQTSHSVITAREVLDNTIHAHQIITKRKFKRKLLFLFIGLTFISILFFLIIISIRIH